MQGSDTLAKYVVQAWHQRGADLDIFIKNEFKEEVKHVLVQIVEFEPEMEASERSDFSKIIFSICLKYHVFFQYNRTIEGDVFFKRTLRCLWGACS